MGMWGEGRGAAPDLGLLGLVVIHGLLAGPGTVAAQTATRPDRDTGVLFFDDFESGLSAWSFPHGAGHALVAAGEAQGTALQMAVESLPVYALIDGSETWGDVRVEGRVLFPTDDHAYLGFIYHYVDDGRRIDFGSLYIKGNDGYVQANEHYDTNVGRTFYPELRAHLTGPSTVRPGEWQRFALEIVGRDAHLYVGDTDRPVMTLSESPRDRGAIGFKPRNPGAPVLIDDVRVVSIDRLAWDGAPQPDPSYHRTEFITDWSVLGPLDSYVDAVERGGTPDDFRVQPTVGTGPTVSWRPMPADHRGAVPTGRVLEYRGPRRTGYFRARVSVGPGERPSVYLSSTDDVAVWVDGAFQGFEPGMGAAWFDAPGNLDRPAVRVSSALGPGEHEVVLRVVGGVYATGGFYAWLADGRPAPGSGRSSR